MVAAAAVVTLAVGVVAIAHENAHHPNRLQTLPAGVRPWAPLPSGPGRQLQHGDVGERSDVPWRSVGRGWTVALWSAGDATSATVYLVNPDGGRYGIATVGAEMPVQWSADARDVLLADYNTGTAAYLDMVTGTLHPISLRKNVTIAGLLPGRAFGVLGYEQSRRGRFVSFGILGPDGGIGTQFPTSAPGAGAFTLGLSSQTLLTPHGELVLAGSTGIALVTSSGKVWRVLAPPAGSTGCQADNMWSATVVVATCGNARGTTGAYLMPLDGSTPSRLELPVPPAGYGPVQNAWAMPGRTLTTLETGCGPPGVELVHSDGTHPRLLLPRARGTYGVVVPLQTYGTTIIARTTGDNGCAGGRGPSLMSYDIRTHKSAVLLGPGLNGGAVTAELAWPGGPSR
jgi:TolB protein